MMSLPSTLLVVALGGAIGGVARYWVSRLVTDRMGRAQWGIFAVNASGALLMGLLAGRVLDPATLSTAGLTHWSFFATGVLGSYTTVSSFSLQAIELAGSGRYRAALLYIAGTLAVCIGFTAFGYALGAAL